MIDDRTEPEQALKMITEASCVFLMGGNAMEQMRLIGDKGIREVLVSCPAATLGVSAGSMNMGKTTVDIWESLVPYEGLGFADITMIGHFSYEAEERLNLMKQVSMIFSVCAMADESAIFIRDAQVTCTGEIHWIEKGEIKAFSPNMIMRGRDAMTIRLIASDLDGTLYRDDKTISERTKNTLAQAAKRKICFVPVTGRSILGVDRLIRELPWIRYVITGNGARIYDLASNTVIHEELLPASQVIKMQELSLTLPVACACYIGDQGYISLHDYDRLDAYLPDKNLLKDVRRLHEPVEDLAETLREKQQGVLKFQVYFSDVKLRKPVTEAFLNMFPDVSAASTLEYNVEITSKNADKGNALRVLCDHLHMPLSAAIAFGDGVNDMTLLSQAGIGVAMRNSMAEVFSAADAVTDTNNHDGVASYIEQHLL